MQILVAEDDVTSRTILSSVLKKWGYEPIAVGDGISAWRIMQKSDSPVLAILDWEMPGMDGVEVCRKIRKNRSSNPPYLIILTARGEKADIVRGLDAGANDYVSKPYDSDELRARIKVGRRMLELQAQLLEAKELLAHEAMHDSLTGALNRKAILDGLEKEMKRAERRNSKLSIGLCDIDHFKKVNDTYGHQVGDEVLRLFVREIQSDLRGYDLLGRYGGEEFLVVAPDSTGTFEEGLYERLRARIAGRRMAFKTGSFCITVSIGVAGAESGATVEEILAAADAALYLAKDEGRNRIVYASDMSVKSKTRDFKVISQRG
jgi:diguanylate cyclase (GGDEF)-like protein